MARAYLGLGVVLGLLVTANQRPSLVGVEQIRDIVADDTSRAGVDESLDACLLAGVNDSLCTVDVDLFEHIVTNLGVDSYRRGRVDDNIGLELLE